MNPPPRPECSTPCGNSKRPHRAKLLRSHHDYPVVRAPCSGPTPRSPFQSDSCCSAPEVQEGGAGTVTDQCRGQVETCSSKDKAAAAPTPLPAAVAVYYEPVFQALPNEHDLDVVLGAVMDAVASRFLAYSASLQRHGLANLTAPPCSAMASLTLQRLPAAPWPR